MANDPTTTTTTANNPAGTTSTTSTASTAGTNSANTTSGTDVIELLTAQHREVQHLWQQLESAGRGSASNEIAQSIVTKLSQHDALETMLLYPELRKFGERGERLSAHSLDEHKQVRELLSRIDGQDVRNPDRYASLARCMELVERHIAEEEQQAFPFLRQHVSAQRLSELGAELRDQLPSAPTHPHLHTPDSKLGATVMGKAAGMVDKLRDR